MIDPLTAFFLMMFLWAATITYTVKMAARERPRSRRAAVRPGGNRFSSID